MKKMAVIVAGGSGSRMGSVLPKQFLQINQKPILWYTLHTFLKSYRDIQIIVVLPADFYDAGKMITEEFDCLFPILTVTGGPTRFHSVQKGLSLITEPSVIFIHDAVRCLVTPSLIHHCFDETVRFGSAVPCIDSGDSIRILTDSGSHSIARTRIRLIQTPQTYLSSILLPAYEKPYQENFTDDASVVEASGNEVHLVKGEQNNIKITTPLDFAIAEKLLAIPSV